LKDWGKAMNILNSIRRILGPLMYTALSNVSGIKMKTSAQNSWEMLKQ
jgi:hypothetical protein